MKVGIELPSKVGAGVAVGGGLFFALIGLLMLLSSGSGNGPFAFVFLALGLIVAASGAHTLMAHAAFQRADLIADAPVKLGGTAKLGLMLLPAKRALNFGTGSKVVLECVEEAVYSAGTRSRTYTETLHTDTLPLELPRLLEGPFDQDITVKIPHHVAPSWNGTHNRFYTKVTVHLDIESWPDLKLEARIHVMPEHES